jgi:hypothetical protein
MSHKIDQPRPEFCIDPCKFSGVPLGRLYVPYPWPKSSAFHAWCKSVRIVSEKPYFHRQKTVDKVIWFIAPLDEYYRLAVKYPHSKSSLRAKTHNLIHGFSTLLNDL